MTGVQTCALPISEVNDLEWVKNGENGGGSIYKPSAVGSGGEDAGRGSKASWKAYGSMTYAMMESYLYLNLQKDSPELKAAFKWMKNNYSVTENPGVGQAGWYYYALVFAKTMRTYCSVYDVKTVTDSDGIEHFWADELAFEIIKRQEKNGSWQNEIPRWWESDPVLCTTYAMGALGHCMLFKTETAE